MSATPDHPTGQTDAQATAETDDGPKISHQWTTRLLVVGSLLAATATFGRALIADTPAEQALLALLSVAAVWTGVCLYLIHRRWVRAFETERAERAEQARRREMWADL